MTTRYRRPERTGHRFLACLCLLLALLQVLDLHSTLRAAHEGRTETNPALLWVIARVGFTLALFISKMAAFAITGAYYVVVSSFSRTLWLSISLVPVCVAYIAIVLNNYL